MSVQYMTKTQTLPQFPLKCHPIHPGIHKDPSIGAQMHDCLRYHDGCKGSSWKCKLAILLEVDGMQLLRYEGQTI